MNHFLTNFSDNMKLGNMMRSRTQMGETEALTNEPL